MDEHGEQVDSDEGLVRLLANYAQAAEAQAWQGRLMALEGATAKELVQLHGKLIAQGWIEQNTGVVPTSYRLTTSGRRGFKAAQSRA